CPAAFPGPQDRRQSRIDIDTALAGGRPGAATPMDIIKAIILGFVEGLTEYLPVSSTGHLLLVQHFFGFGDENFGNTFAILIQFGAILALLSIYFTRLVQLAIGFFNNAVARRFVLGVLLSFL